LGKLTAVDASGLEEPKIEGESWLVSKWRPLMAMQYLVVCVCDFIVFPALTIVLNGQDHSHPWQSLTLSNGGMYHIAMGAIVGVSAYMRSQEKIAVFNGPAGSSMSSSSTTISSTEQKRDPAPPDADKTSRAD
jgi:hypothetical protein